MSNTSKNYYVAIMAGGVGSRFWPASRESLPKQFLDILGIGKSLIRMTYERFAKIIPPEQILVVTNKRYVNLVSEHLPELPARNILAEPSRNNTGPCVAYTALRLYADNPNATFVVAPSDHVILKEQTFIQNIEKALAYASDNEVIVTLGIKPTRPDTGYGYIESDQSSALDGVEKVKSFKEKPDTDTAQQYLDDGSYYWNAGIFVWSCKTILSSFKANAPEIHRILTEDMSKYGSTNEQAYIDKVYPQTPSISVDYAILENAQNVYTIPVDIGWSDLGTWNALHAYMEKDESESVIVGDNTLMVNSKNCMVRSDAQKLVVIKDLEEYIVIDEADVLLIYPKNKEQEIKALRKSISNDDFL